MELQSYSGKGTKVKKIEFDKPRFNKLGLILSTIVVTVFLILVLLAIYGVISFFKNYGLQNPIVLRSLIYSKTNDILISPISTKSAKQSLLPLTDQEYICAKFGNNCKIALAITRSESGLRADAINKNTNGTIDVGCWQINSVHLGQNGLTLATALDCKKATDWVYDNLYTYQGFEPWVSFKTGAYLAKL